MEIHCNKPHWLKEFSGVLGNVYGPVTAAKTIYEDKEGFLILISLPFIDLQRVKVSWRNTLTHGIIKVSCISISLQTIYQETQQDFQAYRSIFRALPLRENLLEKSYFQPEFQKMLI
ncbi:HSP20-like chaperones superfamily protein [Abeliophyllum distichum]|uniref:HSP20-like chaperones superfamily protein n=1 Tax=Abeliophyllum distichum TaxID=126358 RepID=A0ABD1VA61_9LAMI